MPINLAFIATVTLWSLSSVGSLVYRTNCDTGHSFLMVISEGLWHSHLLPSVGSGAFTTYFYDLCLLRLRYQHPTLRMRGKRFYGLRHRSGICVFKINDIMKLKTRIATRICVVFFKILIAKDWLCCRQKKYIKCHKSKRDASFVVNLQIHLDDMLT